MQKSISLAIISRFCDLEKAKVAIDSVYNHVDEVCVTIADKTENFKIKLENDGKIKYSFFEWVDDFAAARNFNFSQCTGDWILWLDTDDTLEGADKLKEAVELGEQNGISGFAFLYKYGFDKNGNCNDKHWKTQLLKNNGKFEWQGAIHEDPIQLVPLKWFKYENCIRVHHTSEDDIERSYDRNLRILEKERVKNPNEPRTLFYLGRTYIAAGRFDDAISVLSDYLFISGWNEERYEARLLIGQALLHTGNVDDALQCYNDAILEMESYPDAYIYKGMCYLKKEDYRNALQNFEIAVTKEPPAANTYFNPMLYSQKLPACMASAYLNIGNFDSAIKYANFALSADNKNDEVILLIKTINHVKEKKETAKMFHDLSCRLENRNNKSNIQTLINSVPPDLSDNPFIVSIKNKYCLPKKWDSNSLVIYCGNSPEDWNPGLVDKGGIGGSETAVIELSKRFVKMGMNVTIYNRCGIPSGGMMFDGVEYKNYWEFNFNDEFNIICSWRLPEFFDYNIKSKMSIIDLHDVMNPLDFGKERLEKIDKIFVKTKYHRSLMPSIPDDKFVIIGNGIDLSRFSGSFEREPYRFIYSSTPNRGLDIILEYMWDDIKKALPEAELHTYYGFNTFYELEKHNPERMAWMKKMQVLMKKPGVVNHGRVNQKELAEDIMKSSFWLYPTYFPEIHCITACEMQAGGCIPITSGYAALAETVKTGVTVEGDVYDPKYHKEYVDKVVEYANKDNSTLIEQMTIRAQDFSWDKVADKWLDEFKKYE